MSTKTSAWIRSKRRIIDYTGSLLQFNEIRADIFIVTVLHPKAFRDNAELREADPLIQMSGVDIALDNSVELQDLKADFLCLRYTVKHELFADMLTSAFGADRVARVGDMPAPPDIVRVQNV